MENFVENLLHFSLGMHINKFGIIIATKQFPYFLWISWDRWIMIIRSIKTMPRYAFWIESVSLHSVLTAVEDEIDK